MYKPIPLSAHEAHVWTINLTINTDIETAFYATLSQDECRRAQQFHQPLHRQRFIAAHGALRQILGKYLQVEPQAIEFHYQENKKPYLPSSPICFNLSHSHDIALIAITFENPVGVDIETIRDTYNPALATRYFTMAENESLNAISSENRTAAFFNLWARKEAVIKAMGKGLSQNLASFQVSPLAVEETVNIFSEKWHLASLGINPNYQAAIATQKPLQKISHFTFEPCKNSNTSL